MHDLRNLLSSLRDQRVQLWVHDGHLRYRSPTELSPRLLSRIRRRKDSLIAYLEQSSEAQDACAARPHVLPLSYAQEGLWFIDQMGLSGSAYNLPIILRLRGELRQLALRRTLEEIVRRHEVLRTSYPQVNGYGTQRIERPDTLDYLTLDLAPLDGADRRKRVNRILNEQAAHRFILADAPPLQVRLLRLGDAEHVLIVNVHHIVMDGPSVAILFRELGEIYATICDEEPTPLPELETQYADFAIRQRRRLERGELDRQMAFWKARLADAPESLDLPTDRPRPASPSFKGGLVEFKLTPLLSERVDEQARACGMTPTMFLLAAFQILLSRWSGLTDFCVGMPIAVRGSPQTEPLIGYFLNTLVLRADLHDRPTVDGFLRRVKNHMMEAYENRDLPFDQLVAELQPARNLASQPLFQALFAYEAIGKEALVIPGLQCERLLTELRTAKFDLSLFMAGGESGLSGGFEYASDLFDHATIERLASYFEVLLDAIVVNRQARVVDLPFLRPDDRQQLLFAWNDNRLRLPEEATLQGRFEKQAVLHPDRIAVAFGDLRLSYFDLNARANQLARYLRSAGVGPESLVGICMDRSALMIVGLLGILKAGGAYLPLDPNYPAARLAYMLSDSSARILLTERHLRSRLPEHEADILYLDDDWRNLEMQPTTDPENRTGPQNLAYVIYTSGSTGKPKGVALQHGGAVALLAWADTAFTDEATARTLAATSICFDLSVFEIFAPLASGRTVLLVEDALSLAEAPILPPPTLVNTVPSAAQALLDAAAFPAEVRTVNLAGEPLTRTLVDGLHEALPGAEVVNLYGPSEYTTYTTYCRVDSDPGSRVTIGRPVANTQVYLLDRNGEPTPIGSPGEIFVAGEGLARGYLNRPGLTAERFLPNPFGPTGGRMYATGDLGRYLSDGRIDFLGRIDHQVKIRGFRIEPGEIEATMRRCPGVSAAAVVPRLDRFGARQLVAHVVIDDRAKPDPDRLRAELRLSLPAFMIPGEIEFRDALPLNPNGKIDRTALADAPLPGVLERAQYMEPRDATERLLAEIWADVLRLDRVGANDNFFALGGHSLLASQIIARVRESLKMEVLLRDLFQAPTVAALATLLTSKATTGFSVIRPVGRAEPVPASFAQRRIWFIDQINPGTGLYNVPIAWRLSGRLDVDILERSLNEILRRHEVLRTTFVSDGGLPLQIVADHRDLSLPVTDFSTGPDAESAAWEWLQLDAAAPFDLAGGPLFRAALLKLADMEHVLQLGTHHAIADGWSLDVLLSELGTLYTAYHAGRPSPLLDLPIQYADFSEWQRDLMKGEAAKRHMDFWTNVLDGAPKELKLPSDRPRPRTATFKGETVEFDIDSDLSEELRELSRRSHVTLFMLMSAVLNVLLYRYSGQGDFCVGYSVSNRNRLETEGLIGAFVNILVLRSPLTADQTFQQQLAQVRDAMLEADAHQDLPFEKLVEEFAPERDLSHHPIFQVTYSYSTTHGPRTRKTRSLLGVGEREVTLPELDIGLVEPPYQTAKFDLAMFVSETGDRLEGDFEFTTDLFDRPTIERMVEHFKVLLRSVVTNPNARIDALELVPADERQRLLVEWSRVEPDDIAANSLHSLFEQQVARTPDSLAVRFAGEQLTYTELNRRANRLAHHLISLGVGRDGRVGICLERGPRMLVAMLAVLKTGGAYVPLEQAYPAKRLIRMLTDSGATHVLLCRDVTGRMATGDALVIEFDDEPGVISHLPDTNPDTEVCPDDLACCLFTPSATEPARPVAMQHRNVVAVQSWDRLAYTATETASVLAATPICSHLSVFELFLPLTRGGSVLIVPDIASLTVEDRPSLVNVAPQDAWSLLSAGALSSSVKVVNLIGESLDRELIAAIASSCPEARILTLYGRTEYPIHASRSSVDTGRRGCFRWVPNTRTYILDDRLEPVPTGAVGNVYIAGHGLAQGYLAQPAQTAENFLPDPFGAPGTRMYRTGELGQFFDTGEIEFRGDRDRYVACRGRRTELGEIEHALLRCRGVTAAAVCADARRGARDEVRAFVTLADGTDQTTGNLRLELEVIVPRQMVPAVIVALKQIPRSPGGEIDRRALARMDVRLSVAGATDSVPQTENERRLARIWAEVLRVDRVDLQDHFFALGGHSLLVTQVATRYEQETGYPMPFRAIFEHPTLASLARYVDAEDESGRPSGNAIEPIPSIDRSKATRRGSERAGTA